MVLHLFKLVTYVKTILFVIVLFIGYPALTQSITDLDDRYGIKRFDLGTPVTKYKNQMEFIGNNEGSSYYNYLRRGSETLFDFPIDNITLQFYSDRLYKIVLTFFWGKTDNSKVISNLVDLFGTATENSSMDTPGGQLQQSLIWDGKKVRLALVYDETTTRLTMYSKPIHLEILKEDF